MIPGVSPDDMDAIFDNMSRAREMGRREEARRAQPLIAAAVAVLQTHGLPETCIEDPDLIPWQGSPEQAAALGALHRAICEYLPPLPEDRT